MASPKIEVEETNLEDLIILGEDKKIPITVEFPQGEQTIKAKALIKQLTLKEMEKIKLNKDNPLQMSADILKIALLKTTGENYSEKELYALPMGVLDAISKKIMEVSGINIDNELMDF